MSVSVKPLGVLKSYVGGEIQVNAEAGRTVRETMHALGIPSEVVALVLVNQTPRDKDQVLVDGDVVTLVAVVGGG